MKRIAYWMIGVSVLHTLASIALYGGAYAGFLENGIIAAVADDADRAALWFFASGALMFLIGLCFLHMQTIPKPIGIVLLLVGLVGGILLPKSGFWVLLPPAIGILVSKVQSSE